MAPKIIQLTERQFQNDKNHAQAKGHKDGQKYALWQMLEKAEPDIAFGAVTQFLEMKKHDVIINKHREAAEKNNGNGAKV
jgi:hypothetical protein